MNTQRNHMHAPSHPGQILSEMTIPGLKLTPEGAAVQLGISLDELSRVLNADAPVTAEFALRIEAWLGAKTGGDAEHWLRMQNQYDLWLASQRAIEAEVTPAPGWHPSTKPEALRNPRNNPEPVHPGKVLRDDYMTPAGLDATTLAEALRVPTVVLDAIFEGRRKIDFEFACRVIERFGGDVASWLSLQNSYDSKTTRRHPHISDEEEATIQRGIEQDPIDAAEISSEQIKKMRTIRGWLQEKYTYRIVWSDEDLESAGLCDEFPGLSWLAPTKEEALAGIRQLVADSLDEMAQAGEPLPKPIGIKDTR